MPARLPRRPKRRVMSAVWSSSAPGGLDRARPPKAATRPDLPAVDALASPTVGEVEADDNAQSRLVPHVDVGVVIVEVGQLADRAYEPGPRRERPGSEEGASSFPQHTPIFGSLGLVELPRRNPVGQALNVSVRPG